jgi:hypothetical protein
MEFNPELVDLGENVRQPYAFALARSRPAPPHLGYQIFQALPGIQVRPLKQMDTPTGIVEIKSIMVGIKESENSS